MFQLIETGKSFIDSFCFIKKASKVIKVTEPNEVQQQPSKMIFRTDRSNIVHGPKETFKKSVFQCHICCVESVESALEVYKYLKSIKTLSKASHNMMAYRLVDSNNIIRKDNDDDGETAAGSRLAHLLEMMQVENKIVVVSRWFGGTLLGPQRFKIINNVARKLILSSQDKKSNKSSTSTGLSSVTGSTS